MIPERTPKSKAGLKEMIKYISKHGNTKDLTILEIGTWSGASAEIFSESFKTVICVDPYDQNILEAGLQRYDIQDVKEIFKARQKKAGNILHLEMKSSDAIKILQPFLKEQGIKQIDIVYIDGSHDYIGVLSDIINYKPIAKKFLAGHDYSSKFPGVIRATKAMDRKPDKIFPDTSFIYRITN
jgi:predicted O-methyltransferase YrrM